MPKNKRKKLILSGQRRLILLISLIYIVAWFTYYLETPMGQFTTEHENQTLTIAQNLFSETTQSKEAGITLYQTSLGVLNLFTDSTAGLILASRLINAIALIISAGLCASAAGLLWGRNRALWVTGIMTGLCPMLIFWMGDISPLLLGTLMLTTGIWTLLQWMRNRKNQLLFWSSCCFTLAAALKPILLPWMTLYPLIIFVISSRRKLKYSTISLAGPAILLISLALTPLSLPETGLNFDTSNIVSKAHGLISNTSGNDVKTFSVHRKIHTLLLLNPLHWGLFLITGALGAYTCIKAHKADKKFYVISSIAIATILTILATESSVNNRLILIPILALLSGGLVLLPRLWFGGDQSTKTSLIAIVVILATLSFPKLSSLDHKENWISDYEMIAEANLEAGNTETAAIWARKVTEVKPHNQRMIDAINRSSFEEWAFGLKPKPIPVEIASNNLQILKANKSSNALSQSIEAIYLLKLRRSDEAIQLWQDNKEHSALAYAGLIWTRKQPKPTEESLTPYIGDPYFELLKEVSQHSANKSTRMNVLLTNLFAYAH